MTVATEERDAKIDALSEEIENLWKDVEDHKEAIKELQGQIAEISIEVASKVVQKSLSMDEHGKLIDDYVAEVGKLYEG